MSLEEYFYLSSSIYTTLGVVVWLILLILAFSLFALARKFLKKAEGTVKQTEEFIIESKKKLFFATVLSHALNRILGKDLKKIFSEAEKGYKRKD